MKAAASKNRVADKLDRLVSFRMSFYLVNNKPFIMWLALLDELLIL